jgi:hypothetical protein
MRGLQAEGRSIHEELNVERSARFSSDLIDVLVGRSARSGPIIHGSMSTHPVAAYNNSEPAQAGHTASDI